MSHAMTPTTLTALMLFIIPPAGSVHAATIYVPGDHPTIQEAIDAAQNYDTVVVSPSTYQENISFGGKLITLTGTDPSDPGIVATTIIDGGGLGPVVTFVGTEGPDAVLAGLTITNGWGTYGGGVQGSRTGARILDCAVIDNQADFGGGIYGCDGEITRCEVSGNTAEWDGGGIYRSDALIYDCTISKNQASNGDGGGLHDCHGDIEACTISSNGADSQGGGLAYCNGTITDSVIGANSSGLDGGGLYDCMGTIDGCTITNNTTVNAGGGLAYCGGTISRCTISGNVSLHEGGGLANCSGEVVSCIIRANFSLGDQSGNYGHGGGLSRCYATIANSLISGNKANRDGGGFYRCYAGTIRNSTIVGNLAMAQGGGLKECTGQVTSCILWSNRAADGSHQWLEGSSPQYSCIEGLKNIAADPLFVDPGHWDRNGTPGDYTDDTWIEGDYHLTAASPTINAGDPGYTPASGETDIDGDPRLNHGRVDIGADEFPIDCNTNGVNDDLDFTAGTSLDCNGNDVPDECDVVAGTSEDCNSNLVPDLCDVALSDCNGNDVPDECDVVGGTSEDCNSNLIPDLCEVPFSAQSPQLSPLGTGYSQSHVFSSPPVATTDVALTFTAVGDLGYSNEYVSVYINESYVGRVFQYSGTDCPSLPDVQEITVSAGTFNAALAGGDLAINMNASSYVNATQCSPMSYISVAVEHGPAGDCNGNRVPDACDLADGTSTDCDTDGLPDECQLGGRDCNTNSLLDDCEIAAGTAGDCDTDGLPDECQLEGRDCNTNGLLDDCEVAAGTAADCDSSGLPDMCELDGRDCNVNGFLDDCEVSAGTSEDCNTNQLPDECDLAGGTSADVNTTGVPDECEGWVLYVDDSAPAGGNGRSWAAPYNDLQKALHSAVPGDAIHVAQGTYAPAGPGWDRPATFQLRSGVGLYGGYAGYGQPEPDARNCALYETVLTGDLNGDDGSVGTSENSYHVVTVSSVEQNTVLDGFTIKAGIADGSSPHNDGGAMYINNDGGSVVVRACSFSSNLADSRGGAVYNAYGDSSFLRCTWDGNTANGYGGGMYIDHGAATLVDCAFTGNQAYTSGGAIYDVGSDATFTHCTFDGNSVSSPSGTGGAIYNDDSDGTLTTCTFTGNAANGGSEAYGGAMYNSYSAPILVACAFHGNSANRRGGGMYNHYSDPMLRECVFIGNAASGGQGGAMYSYGSSPTAVTCVFNGNSSSNSGGAVYNYYYGSYPVFVNCTFSRNAVVSGYGGGMYNSVSSATLRSCVLWGNTADNGAQIYGSSTAVSYSSIEDGWAGTGNIALDPLFVDADGPDDIPGTADDDLRLTAGSPCINTGDPDFIPEPGETDLDGHARVLCGRVEMGAYEFGIGDHNCSQTVDLTDFAGWAACMTGPDVGPYDPGCEAFDFEYDGDVDAEDYAGFQAIMPSPGKSGRRAIDGDAHAAGSL